VPLTQGHVENEILRLVALLEDRTEELAGYAREAAEAEAEHKRLYAVHFLEQQEGTDAKKKYVADVATSPAFTRRKLAEAVYESCKQSILSLRAQIDSLRTVSANIRAQT
jgi:hypothetical protein